LASQFLVSYVFPFVAKILSAISKHKSAFFKFMTSLTGRNVLSLEMWDKILIFAVLRQWLLRQR